MHINEAVAYVHNWARDKGWWDSDTLDVLPIKIALLHSELSEALEEWRDHRDEVYFVTDKNGQTKPEGVPIELVDVLIRLFDLFGGLNIEDVETLFREKMAYNETRQYRHGGRRA